MLTVFVTYHYFLGLKNLNVITKTARLVESNYGTRLDLYNLPQDPEVYKAVFAKGKTQAIFQFESQGMRNMLKRFEPTCFSDIVLLVACYRPGPLQYLPDIIKRKHGHTDVADTAITHIPEIESIVSPTYLAIVYQEQVQQIFRTLAGYSLGQADLVRRAMGHKKMDVLIAEKEAFLHGDAKRNIVGCEANGIDVEMADKLFEEMMDFAKYAFNKSHAAAYAVIAYITAWLKFHYPTEFYIATLEFSDVSKYPELIAEAKDFGVHVFGPDIENSKIGFSGKNKNIYFGFSGIKGIGDAVKVDKMECPSFSKFIADTQLSESTVKILIESGAFDRKVKNRQALLAVLPDYYDFKKKIKDKTKDIELCTQMLQDLEHGIPLDRKKYGITTKSLPTAKKLHQKIADCEAKIGEATQEISQIIIPCEQVMDNVEENLEREKELIGMYASGHPLDSYGTPHDHQCIPLNELEVEEDKYSTSSIFGKVINYRKITTKKTGEDMCFFQVLDQTGVIDVCCFPKTYHLCGDNIREGAIMTFIGRKEAKKGEEDAYQFILDSRPNAAQCVYDKKGKVIVGILDISLWKHTQKLLLQYTVTSGHPLYIYDETTGSLYQTTLRVTGAITKDNRFHSQMVA